MDELTLTDAYEIKLRGSLDKTGKFCIEIFSDDDCDHYAVVYLTDDQIHDLMAWLGEAIVKKRGFI